MAKKGYSFGALVDFVESLQWKTNWAIPVGAILPFPKEPLPVGFLKLDGSKFDKDVYKDLFEFLGTDVLPNFTNLTPKMIGSDLAASQIKGWEWPEHNHSVSSHSHTHTRGTQEISGFVRVISETYEASGQAGGAFAKTESIIGNGTPSNVDATSSGSFDFYASRNWTGATSSDSHGHTIGMAGNSTKVEVDRIGVIYAIKAYGHVEEGYEVQFSSLITSIQNLSRTIEDTNKRIDVSRDRMKDQVGVPIPWGNAPLPTGYIKMNGQAFDKAKNPKLAAMYPSGIVPDLRGEFLRGFDDGRGVDVGRVNGGTQGDAMRNITGSLSSPGGVYQFIGESIVATGAFTSNGNDKSSAIPDAGGHSGPSRIDFNAALVTPTANENRPRNIAMLYICMTDTAINF